MLHSLCGSFNQLCRSNSLFSLWNNYQGKLPLEYFTEQLLRVADLLYEAGLYSLARTHGYRKCLMTGGLLLGDRRNSSEALEQYVSSGNRSEKMVLALVSDVCTSGGMLRTEGWEAEEVQHGSRNADSACFFLHRLHYKKGHAESAIYDTCRTSSGQGVLHVRPPPSPFFHLPLCRSPQSLS